MGIRFSLAGGSRLDLVAQRAQEDVFQALGSRPQVADLNPALAGGAEEQLGTLTVRQEHAVAVLALGPLAAVVLEVGEKAGRVSLHPHFENAAPGTRQLGDRPL